MYVCAMHPRLLTLISIARVSLRSLATTKAQEAVLIDKGMGVLDVVLFEFVLDERQILPCLLQLLVL